MMALQRGKLGSLTSRRFREIKDVILDDLEYERGSSRFFLNQIYSKIPDFGVLDEFILAVEAVRKPDLVELYDRWVEGIEKVRISSQVKTIFLIIFTDFPRLIIELPTS